MIDCIQPNRQCDSACTGVTFGAERLFNRRDNLGHFSALQRLDSRARHPQHLVWSAQDHAQLRSLPLLDILLPSGVEGLGPPFPAPYLPRYAALDHGARAEDVVGELVLATGAEERGQTAFGPEQATGAGLDVDTEGGEAEGGEEVGGVAGVGEGGEEVGGGKAGGWVVEVQIEVPGAGSGTGCGGEGGPSVGVGRRALVVERRGHEVVGRCSASVVRIHRASGRRVRLVWVTGR